MASLRLGLLALKEDGRLQSCRFGCLDTWYVIGFKLFYDDLYGFSWISRIPGAESLRPVAALRLGLLALKEDGRLRSCRLGGLDAGYLEAWILEPWRLVALLAGWWIYVAAR